MKNPMTVLARLWKRAEHPVVTQLYTHAIGRPLLIHPAIGQQVIGAYMAGAVDSPGGIVESDSPASIAVLNISGGLVSRPMPGLCDDGPMSYEAIGDALDSAMADPSISAVILRMDSPGGMVSGAFDLTDRIHASRGTKPIVAVVDDMAYSAGYAIASAADEIWLSRSGGVGSIGVVAYHIDQSGADAQMGVKVTPIYAGGHKVDFSPHAPLSEEAKAREQAEVDSLYALFVDSVARYRGMDAEAVRATDAMTYTGQAAIDAGLADRLGTFRDAVESLAGRIAADRAAAEAAQVRLVEEQAAKAKAEAEAIERAAAVDLVMQANIAPDLRDAILKAAAVAADIPARIEHAQAVADLCRAAGVRSCAEQYVAAHTPIEVVRTQLIDLKADSGPEIDTTIPQKAKPAGVNTSAEEVYRQRKQHVSP